MEFYSRDEEGWAEESGRGNKGACRVLRRKVLAASHGWYLHPRDRCGGGRLAEQVGVGGGLGRGSGGEGTHEGAEMSNKLLECEVEDILEERRGGRGAGGDMAHDLPAGVQGSHHTARGSGRPSGLIRGGVITASLRTRPRRGICAWGKESRGR